MIENKFNQYYVVEYNYEVEDRNYNGISRYALIGVFSSERKAINAINELIKKEGFDEHSRDCFTIDTYDINKTEWSEGFFKMTL